MRATLIAALRPRVDVAAKKLVWIAAELALGAADCIEAGPLLWAAPRIGCLEDANFIGPTAIQIATRPSATTTLPRSRIATMLPGRATERFGVRVRVIAPLLPRLWAALIAGRCLLRTAIRARGLPRDTLRNSVRSSPGIEITAAAVNGEG